VLLTSSLARGEDDDFVPPSSSLPAQRTGGASRGGSNVTLSILAPAASLKSFLIRSLREIADQPRSEILDRRYEKFRRMGVFEEEILPSNGQA